MATAHGLTREVGGSLKFKDCKCGCKGFAEEHKAHNFRLRKLATCEPAEVVKCPVGDCWHVFNPALKPKEEYLKMLIDGSMARKFEAAEQRKRAQQQIQSVPVEYLSRPVEATCTKIGYASQALADAVLADAKASGRDEKRVYECNVCKRWHLTSLEAFVNPEDFVTEELMSFVQPNGRVIAEAVKAGAKLVNITLRQNGQSIRLLPENLNGLKIGIDMLLKGARS